MCGEKVFVIYIRVRRLIFYIWEKVFVNVNEKLFNLK